MFYYYGWYDGKKTDNGNVSLNYWNEVVNSYPVVFHPDPDFPPSESHNLGDRYKTHNYILSIHKMIEEHPPHRKFIIDIPLCEVWVDKSNPEFPDGYRIHPDGRREAIPIMKSLEDIAQIILEFKDNPAVVGWYVADEPEVWGYREVVNDSVVNDNPPIQYQFLKDRYDLIKAMSPKPQMVVFVDETLFRNRYAEDIRRFGRFYDVFGVDKYPFQKDGKNLSLESVKRFVDFERTLYSGVLSRFAFVGQGIGANVVNGNNLRSPTLQDHEYMFKYIFFEVANQDLWAYLLWSRFYASSDNVVTGNNALALNSNWSLDPYKPTPPPTPKLPWWKRLLRWLGLA